MTSILIFLFNLSFTIYYRKTVQTIAFLGWLHYDRKLKNRSSYTHLIVVPASTLANWMNEFSKFCPQLKIVRFHGTQAEKYQVMRILKRSLHANPKHSTKGTINSIHFIFIHIKSSNIK